MSSNRLMSVVSAIEHGTPPDIAVLSVPLSIDGSGSLVPSCYLEPLEPYSRGLDRSAAGMLIDLYLRSGAQLYSTGTRPAIFAAYELKKDGLFRQLGYRSSAAYAREELRISGRTFNDMARLAERLKPLPKLFSAFLSGELTETQARLAAGIATPEDEADWLEVAQRKTARGLKAAIRKARQQRAESEERDRQAAGGDQRGDAGETGGDADETGGDQYREPRRRHTHPIPSWMLGRADAATELCCRVAGAELPTGTRWELIAAEFVSGAETRLAEAERKTLKDGTVLEEPSGLPIMSAQGDASGSQESSWRVDQNADPWRVQRYLEESTDRWKFIPNERSPVVMEGPWARIAEECAALSRLATPGDDNASERPAEKTAARELNRRLRQGLRLRRKLAWQLGRLLRTLYDRRLWRDMQFASFSHYVTERLGISPRVAQRLIRIDRHAWWYPELACAYQRGDPSVLEAELLVRVLGLGGVNASAESAWVEYAQRVTTRRLCEAVRWAERQSAERNDGWLAAEGPPPADNHDLGPEFSTPDIEPGGGMEVSRSEKDVPAPDDKHEGQLSPRPDDAEATGDAPMFSNPEVRGISPESFGLREYPAGWCDQPATGELIIWMTEGESETVDRAIAAVRAIRGEDWPTWACLNDLVDHFEQQYDSEPFRELKQKHPILERDGWHCQAPGCDARSALQVHHIVFRGQGGTDEPENLVTLCDFHHMALHRGWISCRGRAPDQLYWEFGCGDGHPPIARFLGDWRLHDDEFWDGHVVRKISEGSQRVL